MSRLIAGELSGRQRQVLSLAAQGLRDDEMAARLHLSRSTIRQHLHKIHRRLKARNTTQAVVIALSRRILSLEDVAGASLSVGTGDLYGGGSGADLQRGL